jgi:hypothetical protein
MQASEGTKVTVRYICRREDGTIYDFADRDTLQFVVGQEEIFPTLENGVLGASPGDLIVIKVPRAEMDDFSYYQGEAPVTSGFPAGGTSGKSEQYNIAPGEEEDVDTSPSPSPMQVIDEEAPDGQPSEYFLFEVEVLDVQDARLDMDV